MRETEALAEEEGLPPLGARVLMTTRFMPGQTVSALRAHLGATVPTLARILGDLDRRGLIERRRDETEESDGRTRRVYLSHTGLQLTDPAVIALRDRLRRAYRMAGADAVSGVRTVLEKLR
ncbi:MAG: MarR family winged helix-turn-helix transcriptional regulator [Pseudomonadota bacterium]